ncbi:MAG: CcoQ/FixQ family Cbb3-type cytochrome c oxidase assembly chaperone [Ilyomonas sp.]
MRFIQYLEKTTGVDIFAMTAFFIFFSFFIGASLWAWKADKKLIEKINNIPLEDSINN